MYLLEPLLTHSVIKFSCIYMFITQFLHLFVSILYMYILYMYTNYICIYCYVPMSMNYAREKKYI